MNEPNLSYSPPPSEPPLEPFPEKHSRLGIASLVLAVLALLTFCLDLVLVFSLSGGLTVNPSYQVIDVVFSCLAGLLALVGLGLGIAAVAQKNTKKVFGIIGLVLSGLFLLIYCGLVGFNLINVFGNM